jgi:hypothetical protein
LELQEFSNAVKDVSTVFNSSDDGAEIIIEEDDACGLFCYLGACDAHCKAYVCFFERWSIVGAVASHCDDVVELLEPSCQNIFILRRRPRQDSKLICNFFEDGDVFDFFFIFRLVLSN